MLQAISQRASVLGLQHGIAVIGEELTPFVITDNFGDEGTTVRQNDQRMRLGTFWNGQVTGNLTSVACWVLDVAHFAQVFGFQQRVLGADKAECAILQEVIGARVLGTGIVHDHCFSITRTGCHRQLVRIRNGPFERGK